MDVEIRTLDREHAERVFALRVQAFRASGADFASWVERAPLHQFLGAFGADDLIGVLEVAPLGQYFGGRAVPMGGIASVAVAPERRGQGIAPLLLAAALDRMRSDGLVLSMLHPATTRLYRTAGWEIGGDRPVHALPARSLALLTHGEPECLRRAGSDDLTLVQECYARVAPAHPGWVDRPDAWWARQHPVAGEHRYCSVFDNGGGGPIDGYVRWRQVPRPARWGCDIVVDELVAAHPVASVTLWRLLGSNAAQVETITVAGGPVGSLLLALPEQDVAKVGGLHWMLRLVDAPGAVAARGYPPGVSARVHLEVVDRQVPENDGRFVLEVVDGLAALERGGTGDVRLGVGALSALYTGWAAPGTLADAGLVHPSSGEDLANLGAIFAGPAPSTLDDF